VTPFALQSFSTAPESRSTTSPIHAAVCPMSTTGSAWTPIDSAEPASSARPATDTSAFEGIHPRLRQVPP
jgi:hypothetical protein